MSHKRSSSVIENEPFLQIVEGTAKKLKKPKKPSKEKDPSAPKKKRNTTSALARFRSQTLAKKKELIRTKKQIDRELKSIIKDLGKLKRQPKSK